MKYLLLIFIGPLLLWFSPRGADSPQNARRCIECHADLLSNSVVHPIAEEGCELCHEKTGAKHPGKEAGFTIAEPYPDLCHICHDSKTSKANIHSPVKDGNCAGCHSPHSTNHRSLILDDFSENACLDCHYIEFDTKTVHGPVAEGECQACHDPHQSDQENNLKKVLVEQCLTCHDKPVVTAEKSLVAISELLVSGNNLHGPVDNGDCISCHFPHSGEFAFLLIGEYPVEQYTEATVEKFDLCFMCHDSDILTLERTTIATNFRNGDLNLHYLHIRGNRGRNCNLCHNAHGAPGEHLLEESVMFGRWKMPMGLELNANGGSCATGCHKRLAYDRRAM